MTKKYIVIRSPWPVRLPSGTEIIKVEDPTGKGDNWFKRVDGKDLFSDIVPSKYDGAFKLFVDEFKELES
jgi:hypothetical protein